MKNITSDITSNEKNQQRHDKDLACYSEFISVEHFFSYKKNEIKTKGGRGWEKGGGE